MLLLCNAVLSIVVKLKKMVLLAKNGRIFAAFIIAYIIVSVKYRIFHASFLFSFIRNSCAGRVPVGGIRNWIVPRLLYPS